MEGEFSAHQVNRHRCRASTDPPMATSLALLDLVDSGHDSEQLRMRPLHTEPKPTSYWAPSICPLLSRDFKPLSPETAAEALLNFLSFAFPLYTYSYHPSLDLADWRALDLSVPFYLTRLAFM